MIGAAVLAAVFALYALLAARLERWSITAPILFVSAGVLLGPEVTNLFPISLENDTARHLTELTLAVLLFTDASSVGLRELEGDWRLPGRLLVVGLPLTMALGALVAGLLFPSAGWAVAALTAAILAPTDAALGLAVVMNPDVPSRIRRALNVESGLNDGIATPFVLLFLALSVSEEGLGGGGWLAGAAAEIGLAVLVATAVGGGGGWLVRAAGKRRWTTPVSEQVFVLALALTAYGTSVAIGGNGFIAAFAGGAVFGAAAGRRMKERVAFAETVGETASYFVWVLFGVLFVGPVMTGGIDPLAVIYAVLSLTAIRMVPVAIALLGTGLRSSTVAFIGWFGPRGLASVVFTLIALDELGDVVGLSDTLSEVATWTVLLSVVAHGLTSGPFARRYGAGLAGARGIPETMTTPEPGIRRRSMVA